MKIREYICISCGHIWKDVPPINKRTNHKCPECKTYRCTLKEYYDEHTKTKQKDTK